MVHPARILCYTESLEEEIHLKKTYKHSGYSDWDISQLQKKKFLPFQHTSSYKISRLLAMHVRTIHISSKKTVHTLWPLKDR